MYGQVQVQMELQGDGGTAIVGLGPCYTAGTPQSSAALCNRSGLQ